MKIVICGSMTFSKEMVKTKEELKKLGHVGILTEMMNAYLLDDPKEIERVTIKYKTEKNAIIEYWDFIKNSDAILVVNYDRKGIKNYIGGNAFLEMGFAYGFGKKIFLINSIPDMIYTDELKAMRPIIINRNLKKIK